MPGTIASGLRSSKKSKKSEAEAHVDEKIEEFKSNPNEPESGLIQMGEEEPYTNGYVEDLKHKYEEERLKMVD